MKFVSLTDGHTLYEHNSDLALNPASNVKIVTAAAALKEMGPDFTFKTEFWSDHLINSKGQLDNLWIKGFGDPVLVTEEMEAIADQFASAGLKEIQGKIFIDDSYFDRYHAMNYLSDLGDRVYTIITGPLSFNFNRPLNRRNKRIEVLGDQEAEASFSGGITDPGLYTGAMFVKELERRGIVVQGPITREAIPSQALVTLSHSSPPLKEVIKGMGKFSNNFIAEQLLRTLGAVSYGAPGSMEKGIRASRDYLASLGIPKDSFVIDNGSGLSKVARLSSGQFVTVLQDIYKETWRDDFISSLSIAAVDGTLRHRMRRSPLAGKVYAKTGTLNGAKSLSGYLLDGQRQIAFSLLFNDFHTSSTRVSRVEQLILEAIMRERL